MDLKYYFPSDLSAKIWNEFRDKDMIAEYPRRSLVDALKEALRDDRVSVLVYYEDEVSFIWKNPWCVKDE